MIDVIDKSLEIIDIGHEVHNQSQNKSAGPWVGRAQLSLDIKSFVSSRKKIPVTQKIESPVKIDLGKEEEFIKIFEESGEKKK